jgi:hypothetical protein
MLWQAHFSESRKEMPADDLLITLLRGSRREHFFRPGPWLNDPISRTPHLDKERRAQDYPYGFSSRFEGRPGANPAMSSLLRDAMDQD